jgi:guanylate kinase
MNALRLPEFPPPAPLILVVSGPSGVGKTVLCDRLVDGNPLLVHSVSATTRPARSGETEGEDYFFLDEATFKARVEAGEFLEWATVHDHLYGTPQASLDAHLAAGRSPVLDVDVQGGRSVKRLRPDAVLVMVAPPSAEVLEARLRGRRTDREEDVRRRLERASRELAEWSHYDYLVVNRDLDRAVEEIRAILTAETLRIRRREASEGPA